MNTKLFCLVVGLALIAIKTSAQTFTTLHSFTATRTNTSGLYTNSDGANSYAGLILTNNTLYGTASSGGSFGRGTVFAVKTDGTSFTNLHSLRFGDGSQPLAGLVLSSNTLYGTTAAYNNTSYHPVFAVNTDGTGFTNLHSFTNGNNGASLRAELVLAGNTLYGTAYDGGHPVANNGSVFAINTDGSGVTNLHTFTAFPDHPPYTNTDGAHPSGRLLLHGNTLYGTAPQGGTFGNGTVFSVNTDGTGFTNLHNFAGGTDGSDPSVGLAVSANTLYGTVKGPAFAYGAVFDVQIDGTGFTNVYTFTDDTDGIVPGELILSGNTLYGTADQGGSFGFGTVFTVKTDGTGFMNLHSFTAITNNPSGVYTNSDGASPRARLLLSGNTLYGTTTYGGSSGNGTVFSISFRPELTIAPSGTNIILSWPTNVAGFDYAGYVLQSTTNLVSPVWSTNSSVPVVISGQNVVTSSITGAQKFYRLKQLL